MAQFIAALREFRRPVALIAIGFVVLQCLLAGLSAAEAIARMASGEAAAVLCHGGPDGGDAPESTVKVAHDCCAVCTISWPVTAGSGTAPSLERFDLASRPATGAVSSGMVLIPPRAVRSGSSQAPPTLS